MEQVPFSPVLSHFLMVVIRHWRSIAWSIFSQRLTQTEILEMTELRIHTYWHSFNRKLLLSIFLHVRQLDTSYFHFLPTFYSIVFWKVENKNAYEHTNLRSLMKNYCRIYGFCFNFTYQLYPFEKYLPDMNGPTSHVNFLECIAYSISHLPSNFKDCAAILFSTCMSTLVSCYQ